MSDTYMYYDHETDEEYEVRFDVSGKFEKQIRNPPGRAHPGASPDVEVTNEGDLPEHVSLDAVEEEIFENVVLEAKRRDGPPDPEPEPDFDPYR